MMAFRAYIITFVFLCILVASTVSGYNQKDVKAWCSQTPNPKPCEYFLTHNSNNKPIKSESEFLEISMKLALDRAVLAKTHAFTLGPKCRDTREKAAWEDCIKLYDLTVSKINETMDPNVKCSKTDAQTWLSTALTNLDTCRAGFLELGVTDVVLPLMSNNVSNLLCNTLAINKVPFNYTPPEKDGFPSWVKPGDRKLLQSSTPKDNAVVAKDGSGNFKTIKDAINAASGSGRFVIYVKQGVYSENLEIRKKNVMLRGDGIGKTIITGSKSVGGGTTTFNSATVAAVGDGFIARGITFRNTAGANNAQAVALRSGSDLSVFYQCSFEAYQDTLYVHSNRQFYRDCDVYGTVDFIFGNAAAVLQNCNIFARRPRSKTNTITAQGRSDPNQNTGIIIHNSRVTAASDLRPVLGSTKTYLGRPWRQYSRTVFMKTSLDSLIDPRGWLEWNGNFALKTLFYAEFQNTGPGASTSGRVTWPGFRVLGSASEASKFTVGTFLAGSSWIPSTVPFTSGL
ncbi:unnamed protein product [Arabidopsis lyrata]|uniref:Pectinesterase n=1 Tax=Arabidopsis lyrata subsp. lyrata TaxID=81972 RepID=D7LCG8_ARALL|nr:probable pectinesterase/pectinesterase inhibitor 17 [Arabidopsis lyrata subsp. lyrata]EFH58261.1 predicted protein [Arabidopsis lyrata subsp. lyrata]CAH8266026.1 unnamed protein product [Arabidopsis lyrata]|eukprot:XP_002882002.1 probable pectinesterase/pectinesterase inhibitor 17 [Arabidopsis lyrata subsp. lyrata]